jgi:hypothetical protein
MTHTHWPAKDERVEETSSLAPWNDCPVAAQLPYPFGMIGLGRGGSLPWSPINKGEGWMKKWADRGRKKKERIFWDTEERKRRNWVEKKSKEKNGGERKLKERNEWTKNKKEKAKEKQEETERKA